MPGGRRAFVLVEREGCVNNSRIFTDPAASPAAFYLHRLRSDQLPERSPQALDLGRLSKPAGVRGQHECRRGSGSRAAGGPAGEQTPPHTGPAPSSKTESPQEGSAPRGRCASSVSQRAAGPVPWGPGRCSVHFPGDQELPGFGLAAFLLFLRWFSKWVF